MKVSAIKCSSYDYNEVKSSILKSIELCGGFPAKIANAKRILINPNLLTAKSPAKAATTHPVIVEVLIEILQTNGVEKIYIGDSPAGSYAWQELWDKTEFAKFADFDNVELIKFDEIETKKLKGVGNIPLLKGLYDFDAIINVPKLKTHALTKITGAVKNSYGLMPGNAKAHFHGDFPSPKKMAKFLAQFYSVVKADWTIMDAIECMEGEGPASGDAKFAGVILGSESALAVDSWACEIFNYTKKDIPLLNNVENLLTKENFERVGDAESLIKSINLKKSKNAQLINRIPEFFFRILTYILSCRPFINQQTCIKCNKCKDVCSQNAIIANGKQELIVKEKKCVLCMCCIEACPCHSIDLISLGIKIKRLLGL